MMEDLIYQATSVALRKNLLSVLSVLTWTVVPAVRLCTKGRKTKQIHKILKDETL